jgi:hypothetical protein
MQQVEKGHIDRWRSAVLLLHGMAAAVAGRVVCGWREAGELACIEHMRRTQ